MAGSDSDDEGSDSDDDDVGSDEAEQILGPATAKKAAKPKARAAGGGGRRRGRAQTGGSRRSSTKRTKTLLTFAALHHMPEHTQGLYVQSLQKQDLIDLRSSIEQETREAVDLNAVDNRRPSVSDLKEGIIEWLRVNKPTGRKRDRSRFENKRKKVHEAGFCDSDASEGEVDDGASEMQKQKELGQRARAASAAASKEAALAKKNASASKKAQVAEDAQNDPQVVFSLAVFVGARNQNENEKGRGGTRAAYNAHFHDKMMSDFAAEGTKAVSNPHWSECLAYTRHGCVVPICLFAGPSN